MKDYSNGLNKNFILNYDVKDGKIIINFKKKKVIIDYTENNEKIVLAQMEKQVEENKWLYEKSRKRCDLRRITLLFLYVCSLGNLLIFPFLGNILLYLTIVLSIGELGFGFLKSDYYDDFEKSLEFVQNKHFLEDTKKMENIKKLDKKIQKKLENETTLNINNIRKIEYYELKKILESLKYTEEQQFEQKTNTDTEKKEQQGSVLTKKI